MNTQEMFGQFAPDTVLLIEIHAQGRFRIGYRWQGREYFPEKEWTYPLSQALERCYQEYCRREKEALAAIGREQAKTLDVPTLSCIITGRYLGSPYEPKTYPRVTADVAMKELNRRLKTSQPQRVEGPAKIAFLKGRSILHRQLHPGEVYEGVCLVYDLSYD